MDTTTEARELISALADGQLRGDAFARAVDAAVTDPEARDAWRTYHVIGDVLRSADLAGGSAPSDFSARLQQRLRQETPPLALHREAVRTSARQRSAAANDSSVRWKLAAGVASVAAVAAIGWNIGGLGAGTAQPQLASAAPAAPGPAAAVLATQRGPMLRDPRLDELLAAHRQLAGSPALQTSGGFLRNATFEGPAR
jgi:sigma-E factor negative regulatory protein RseA